MHQLQHNVVSILYSVKGLIEGHLCRAKEKTFAGEREALADAHAVIQRVYRQNDRALSITKRINRILKAKFEEKKSDIPVSVPEVWQEVHRLLRRQAPVATLEVLERIPENFPRLQCKPSDLREILYCLGENAVQVMGKQGKLIIRAWLGFSAGEMPLGIITVSDTGPGIAPAKLPCLFDPFFSTKEEGGGSGLGLYLVKALVKKNEGSITVSSFEGCGTTFSLAFPVYSAQASSPTPPQEVFG